MLGMEEVPEKEKETYKGLRKVIKKKCRKDKEAWHERLALTAEQAARGTTPELFTRLSTHCQTR